MSAQPAREPSGTPRGGQFASGSTAEPEGVGLTVASAPVEPAPMTREDHRFLAGEFGRFSGGYTDDDINAVLEDLEGAEMVCVWDRTEDGDFTGDSEIVGRVGDGPWRRISPELWNHLAGEDNGLDGGTCSECGGECVVEEDGTSHHLNANGEVDHDADADHVALDESLAANPLGPAPVLSEDTPLLADEPYELQDLDHLERSGANIALDSDDEDVCSCGASLDDGEGYDGLCGNCADRAENDSLTELHENAQLVAADWKQSPSDVHQNRLWRAAEELVDQGRDIGADTDELENAYGSGDTARLANAVRAFRADDEDTTVNDVTAEHSAIKNQLASRGWGVDDDNLVFSEEDGSVTAGDWDSDMPQTTVLEPATGDTWNVVDRDDFSEDHVLGQGLTREAAVTMFAERAEQMHGHGRD